MLVNLNKSAFVGDKPWLLYINNLPLQKLQ